MCSSDLIALYAIELEEKGLSFEEIVPKLEAFRDEMRTYFVLNNLETLRKNGRLTGVKALVASTLSIKPVMGSTDEGTIQQLGQAIGINKSLKKMVDLVIKETSDIAKKRLMITHCNCAERAEYVKTLFLDKVKPRDVIVLDMAGLSSLYANDGGIIVTV